MGRKRVNTPKERWLNTYVGMNLTEMNEMVGELNKVDCVKNGDRLFVDAEAVKDILKKYIAKGTNGFREHFESRLAEKWEEKWEEIFFPEA